MAITDRIRLEGGASAYLSRPEQSGTQGIVLLPSMWGTTTAIEEMATALSADRGWIVCVPEIITEEPTVAVDLDALAIRRKAVASLSDGAVFETLRAAAASTGLEQVSLIGFCVGGMYALKASSMGLFDRIVAFYGMVRVPEYWRNPDQGEPLDYVRGRTDRILAIYGERDEFIRGEDIDAIEAVGVPTRRYPEAGHAFAHDPGQPHYRADDATDAWAHVYAFISHSPDEG